jgi:ATP-binding cassette subfamily B protein
MKDLASLNVYFARYKWRLIVGMLFVALSNVFAVLAPMLVREVLDTVQQSIVSYRLLSGSSTMETMRSLIFRAVLISGIVLLALAFLRGVFMFLMRQTIIVMSRYIEYDQKEAIYRQYQQLHAHFFKMNATGDLMNRISEDVSRVRMYTGPSIMYATNLTVLTIGCIWGMLRVDPRLTLIVAIPLPLLALSIFYVNNIIYHKSEHIQAQLSELTTIAQESFSGIRVIKSYVQEHNIKRFFSGAAINYRESATNLAMTEAIYFPAMNLFIGLSLLATIGAGGYMVIRGDISAGAIAEFVIYLNLLTFPISSIGWVASMTQRAAASQKRINEFLQIEPEIRSEKGADALPDNSLTRGLSVSFEHVSFTYQHTGVKALQQFNLNIQSGQKVAIIGKTGSGKSTIAQLLLRMYDPQEGRILLNGTDIRHLDLHSLRSNIAFAPQDNYLFSDTVYNNICFGKQQATDADVTQAAMVADLARDIDSLQDGYQTMVGERGVMLSGGQKQRIVLARALIKDSPLLILDETLSAVDNSTEQRVLLNMKEIIEDKTVIVITHRLISAWDFDQILLLNDGTIAEQGTHQELMELNGQYARLWRYQVNG